MFQIVEPSYFFFQCDYKIAVIKKQKDMLVPKSHCVAYVKPFPIHSYQTR